MRELSPELALYFRDRLRQARARILTDSEGYHQALIALEQLGAACLGRVAGLKAYRSTLLQLAERSALYAAASGDESGLYTSPDRLYDLLLSARNEAMHQGAYARLLARHSVEFCLLLEDALVTHSSRVEDFMVPNPVMADLWQPIGVARHQMLENSFSCLPIRVPGEGWKLLWDSAVARLLRDVPNSNERKRRLCVTIEEARTALGLKLSDARTVKAGRPAHEIFDDAGSMTLVVDVHDHLLGIVTPFDLL